MSDLSDYLGDVIEGVAWADTGEEAATHVIDILGYRPPPRIIYDRKDLIAAPVGLLVVELNAAAAKDPEVVAWLRVDDAEKGLSWQRPGNLDLFDGGDIELPVIVMSELAGSDDDE